MDHEQADKPLGDPHAPGSHHEVEYDPAMTQRMIAPAVTMGLTWAARRAMNNAYERRTGQEPPAAGDMNMPLGKVLLWSAAMAVVATAIDTIVSRTITKRLPDQDV